MQGRLVLIAVALMACVAGAASVPAEARLRPSPPAEGPVLLAGEIQVGGDHAGVLELRLDGKLQATVPAANGSFELAMPRHGDAGMVSLEFHAPGLRLRSLLGGQARLALRAGADGRLAVGEEDRLRLSPLSTAIAVLASSLDLVQPDSDAALSDAVQAAWPSDMLVATTALERLAVDPSRLPAGFPDGLALVEDPAAFDDAVRADYLLVSEPQLVIDRLAANPLDDGDIGDALVFAGPRVAPGVPPTGHGLVMEREEAGAFRLHDHMFDGPAWNGSIDAHGALAMAPVRPVRSFGGYRFCPSTEWNGVVIVDTLVREVRRLWQGVGVSIWHFGVDRVALFPDCPEFKPEPWRTAELSAAPDMQRVRALTRPRSFVGRQSLPLFCGLPLPHGGLVLEPCGQADHVFAGDGSGVAHPVDAPEVAFSWSLDDHGAIRVDYGESSSRFWIIDAGDRVVKPVAYVAAGEVVGYQGTSSGQATLVRDGLEEGEGGGAGRRRAAPGPRYGTGGD